MPRQWRELLSRTPLQPHTRHAFEDELRAIGDVTHVRLNIFPTAASRGCGCSGGHDENRERKGREVRQARMFLRALRST